MEDDSYTELQYHTDTQPDDKQRYIFDYNLLD